jgi:2-oxoglutarate ferredoxin oxidoreductase subunit alpha
MAKRILMTGNDAIGEGAIRAGCDCYFGYPITPQNELTAYMAEHMPEHGRVFIQAESEIAAINMVFGAAVAGKRAMTSSSSPGISLKQEGISYLAANELPAVIVNVQRGGPGLGNIAPSQADYFQAVKGGGHGDYRLIVLAPDSVQEMHDFTVLAFELADRYRNPVLILADGRLGQMMEPIVLYDKPAPPVPDKPWALTGAKNRKPNMVRSLLLEEGELEKLNLRLQAKYENIQQKEPRYEETGSDSCEILIIAYGTCARVARGAIKLAHEVNRKVGLFRPITLWPFPSAILNRICENNKSLQHIFVVEMSAGQLIEDVKLSIKRNLPVHFLGKLGGAVPTEHEILSCIQEIGQVKPGIIVKKL